MMTTDNLYKLTVRRTKDSEDYYQIRHEDLEDVRDHILYLCCDECKSDLKYTEEDGIYKHIASLMSTRCAEVYELELTGGNYG